MATTKKYITVTLFAAIIFYVAGRFAYEPLYRLNLFLIRELSGGKLIFYGKFPFWFIGDPLFGLVTAIIPVSFLLCYIILVNKVEKAFLQTVSFYLPLFILFYFMVCYYEGFYWVAYNDFYRGKPLTYPLTNINTNWIFLSTIMFTTISCAIINFIIRYRRRKRQPTIPSLLQ